MLHRLVIVILACLAAVVPGCRRAAAPVPTDGATAGERPNFEGSLGDFVAARPTAWVWLDAAAVREDPRLGGFWPDAPSDDPIGAAASNANEVLVVWPDLALTTELRVVRADLDRGAVLESLRSGDNFAGRPFRPTPVGARKLWRPAESDHAIAVPWGDVLVSGPWEAVELALGREAAGTSGPWRDRRFAGHFEAGFHVDPAHVDFARERIANAEIGRALGFVRSVVVAARLEETVEVRVVFELQRGADPRGLAGIVRVALALGITELGVPELAGLWTVETVPGDRPAITVIGAIPDALLAPLADELLAPAGRTGIPDDWLTPTTSPP